MKILGLRVHNFKGTKDFHLVVNGKDASIFGDNGTGKTTLKDAHCYLWLDKDSRGKVVGKEFMIKTLDADGNVIPNLDHEVEEIVEHNGKTHSLRKIYKENWTQKKGSTTKSFSGHVTNHFIDEVPVSANEFAAFVHQIVPEVALRLLTSIEYFNEQTTWQDRRKIVLAVCGDVSGEDVIASNKKLAKLPEVFALLLKNPPPNCDDLPSIVGDQSVDAVRKIISLRQTLINEELKTLPAIIAENHRNLPDISGLNRGSLSMTLRTLKDSLKEVNKDLLQIQSGGEIAQKNIELANIESALLRLENEFQKTINSKVSEKTKLVEDIGTKTRSLERQKNEIVSDAITCSQRIGAARANVEALREQWKSIKAQEFEISLDSVCFACGQSIPEETLDESRARAEAKFNHEKAEALQANGVAGKATMAEITELEKRNAESTQQVEVIKSQSKQCEQEAAYLQSEIASIKADNALAGYPPYDQKMREKNIVIFQIASIQEGNSGGTESLEHQVIDIETEIADVEKTVAKIDTHEGSLKRIAQLEADEKNLATEYEKLTGQLFLVNEFTRTKVSMLDKNVSGKFAHARFKMFNPLVNGGIEETCVTLFGGVPYDGGLNYAARNLVNIDIVNTLSEHYGFTPVIFVDNREGISELPETKSQVINLIKPPRFDNLDQDVQELLVKEHGSANNARKHYDARNKKLRVEIES